MAFGRLCGLLFPQAGAVVGAALLLLDVSPMFRANVVFRRMTRLDTYMGPQWSAPAPSDGEGGRRAERLL